jgi:hypothetical protein
MKAIDLSTTTPTLAEVLNLAGEDNVLLRTPEGRQFVLAEIDDFGDEVERTSRNPALVRLLGERSAEQATFSLEQVRKQLRGKKPRLGKGKKAANGED